MLMTEQILIACDDNLSILYNNYCDKFYEKIISKLGDQTVNEDQFSVKKGGRLDGFFKPNASNLETDIKTIKNLLRMADCCPTDPKDSDDSKNNKDLGAYVVFQVLDSFRDKMAKTPKMYRRSKTMFLESKLKQISQTNSIVGRRLDTGLQVQHG